MNPKDLSSGVPLVIGIAFIALADITGQNTVVGELLDTGALIFILVAVVTFIQHKMKKKAAATNRTSRRSNGSR